MRRIFDPRGARLVAVVAVFGLPVIGAWPIAAAPADRARVTGVTTAAEGRDLHVIVHASAPVHFEVQSVRPTWIVVDILNATLGVRTGTVHGTEGVIDRVRLGQFTPTVVRVVVECAFAVRFDVRATDDQRAVIVAIPNGTERPAGPATIVPGRSIGAVRLGVTLRDAEAVLGPAKETVARPGVGVDYTWYTALILSGLGVRVTNAGTVGQIWVVNDMTYRTPQGLHAGSTEGDVRTALGPPSWAIAVTSQNESTTLMYDALGVWFTVRPSSTDANRKVVLRIDVVEPSPAAPRQNR